MTKSKESRIPLSIPHMGAEERALLLEAFDDNWIAQGPHLGRFEQAARERAGVEHAVALSSGTAAIQIALRLLGVGVGDEVLTASLTFAATANAIVYLGAKPVFVDSDDATWNIDPTLLARELDERSKRGRLPKAVVTVDLYGQCADYEPIWVACERHGVPIVEDAAEALGATYRGRPAGGLGAIGVFSFNGNKILTTGGGGVLLTDREDWAERTRYLASQARQPAPHYEHTEVGYNYRLSNLQAAIGCGQFLNLDRRLEQRRAINEHYRSALGDLPGVHFMPQASFGESTAWLTTLTIDAKVAGVDREAIREHLERRNIEARPVWKPMHLQPVFADCDTVGGAVAEHLFADGLCLPSGSALTSGELARVTDAFRELVDSK